MSTPWGSPAPAQGNPWDAQSAPQPPAPTPPAPQGPPPGWGAPAAPQPPAYGAPAQPAYGAPAPAQTAPPVGGFERPTLGGGPKIQEFEGMLLLVSADRIERGVPTKDYGPADATIATVTVLDGPQAGTTHTEVYVFQKILQGQLRGVVGTGREILGRLGRGQAQGGNSAPWILMDYTDADAATAAQFKAWQAQQQGHQPPF